MAIYNLAGATLTNVFLSANSTVPTVLNGPLSANAGTSVHNLLGSVQEGEGAIASGLLSHAEGAYTTASGYYSHAEGFNNVAYGDGSHAEGVNSRIMASYSHGEGVGNIIGEKVIFSSYTSSTKTFTFSPATSGKFGYLSPGVKIYGYEADNLGDFFSAVVQSRNAVNGNIIITEDVIGTDSTGNYNYLLNSFNIGNAAHVEGENNVAIGYASHAEGLYNIARGNYSHCGGYSSIAGGSQSHAIGYVAAAAGDTAFAGGYETVAANSNSFSHGYRNHTGKRVEFVSYNNSTRTVTFTNNLSSNFAYAVPGTVIGFYDVGLDGNVFGIVESRNAVTGAITFTSDPWGGNTALPGYAVAKTGSNNSFAIGVENQSYGEASFAGGGNNIASGSGSLAFGDSCTAEGILSMALGQYARTGYDYSYIWNSSLNYVSATRIGQYMLSATSNVFSPGTVSIGSDRTDVKLNVFGNVVLGSSGCTATGSTSIATGINTRSTGNGSFTIGTANSALNTATLAAGVNSQATGVGSIAFGNLTRSTNSHTFTQGFETSATALYAAAFGYDTLASGEKSFAIGNITKAEGDSSFAGGDASRVTGVASFGFGNAFIYGNYSGGIGYVEVAGDGAFATGDGAYADKYCSVALGYLSRSVHDYAFVFSDGNNGTAITAFSSTRVGQFAVSASGGMYIPGNVGIGTDSIANKLTVNGTVSASTAVVAGAFVPGANFINTQTGTTYLLTTGDNGRAITLNNASPITVAIPSGLPVGYNVVLVQIGTGQVSLSAGVGVTVNSDGGKTKIASQYSSASLLSYASNIFNFSGNITV